LNQKRRSAKTSPTVEVEGEISCNKERIFKGGKKGRVESRIKVGRVRLKSESRTGGKTA